jgi:hypothetical protein
MSRLSGIYRTFLALVVPALMYAGNTGDDLRTAGDGPYVFYQGDRVVVKYIVPARLGA